MEPQVPTNVRTDSTCSNRKKIHSNKFKIVSAARAGRRGEEIFKYVAKPVEWVVGLYYLGFLPLPESVRRTTYWKLVASMRRLENYLVLLASHTLSTSLTIKIEYGVKKGQNQLIKFDPDAYPPTQMWRTYSAKDTLGIYGTSRRGICSQLPR
jgi:hypothetical protein